MLKPTLDDPGSKQFKNENYNLTMLRHQNIVQILGYCYEIEKEPIEFNGEKVLGDKPKRAICLEYLEKGSLEKHLSDDFGRLGWDTWFKIIKGICEGLKYTLHELKEPLYHLDLKPDNILLDKDLVPKIADFGLSKFFSKELTWTTQNAYGTIGYQPPEYIDKREISRKFDIFSLGVIMMKIVSGSEGYKQNRHMSSDEIIEQVGQDWRNKLQATCSCGSMIEAYCHQVKTCTHIALNCLEENSKKRPDIVNITEMLNEIDRGIDKLSQKGYHKAVSKISRLEPNDVICGHQHNNLMAGPSCSELGLYNAGETLQDVVEKSLVGRTEEKRVLMDSLLKVISKDIVILPIHGIGGIGKTTFARLFYDDPKFKCYSRVWVHVSQIFDMNKINESIISQLSSEMIQTNETQMIHNRLRCLLSGKKILIILDDMWEDKQLELDKLSDMLSSSNSNIIVIVTTRNENVAKKICTNIEPHKISLLTDDMCWEIIKQRSGFYARDDKEQLEDIGKEIAQKCAGVALAAQSLGFTLRSKNSEQWMEVKVSAIWNDHDSKDVQLQNRVLASLKLSYESMDPCMKSCFIYCGMFPKGGKMFKDDLIYQWISLDLIKPTKLLSNKHLSEKYIVHFLGLSFFQQSVSWSPKILDNEYLSDIKWTASFPQVISWLFKCIRGEDDRFNSNLLFCLLWAHHRVPDKKKHSRLSQVKASLCYVISALPPDALTHSNQLRGAGLPLPPTEVTRPCKRMHIHLKYTLARRAQFDSCTAVCANSAFSADQSHVIAGPVLGTTVQWWSPCKKLSKLKELEGTETTRSSKRLRTYSMA